MQLQANECQQPLKARGAGHRIPLEIPEGTTPVDILILIPCTSFQTSELRTARAETLFSLIPCRYV